MTPDQRQRPGRPRQAPAPPRLDGWDVVVVGAGPAGSTCAAHLAARGVRVLLLDRQGFPREKVCGDGLIADALTALDRLGLRHAVAEAGHRASQVTIWSPSRVAVEVAGTFVTLRRERLDAMIAEAAVERGATFAVGRVRRLEPLGSMAVAAHLEGIADPVRARVAVVATGADLSLLAAPGGGGLAADPESAVALRAYVRSRVRIDQLLVSYDRSILPGYAWIFPLGGGEYNVGCGVFHRHARRGRLNLRETFATFAREFPPAADLMAGAESISPLRGARLRCSLAWLPLAARPPVVAVGETLGSTYAFTGEGIGKAMETGEIVADLVALAVERRDPGLLDRVPSELQQRLRPRYVGYERAEAWMSRAWVADVLARLARRRPIVRRAAAGILAESVDPRVVFSWRGVMAALRR